MAEEIRTCQICGADGIVTNDPRPLDEHGEPIEHDGVLLVSLAKTKGGALVCDECFTIGRCEEL